jgi:Na+(H+)/acetate symporter ActP
VMSFVGYRYYNEQANIFSMVENAYKITLAWVFIPLVFGMYWKKTHHISGLLSILFGLWVWIFFEFKIGEFENPQFWYQAIAPQFWWMFASLGWFIMWQCIARFFQVNDQKDTLWAN